MQEEVEEEGNNEDEEGCEKNVEGGTMGGLCLRDHGTLQSDSSYSHCTCTVNCTLYIQCTVYNVHCTLYT